MKHIMAVKPLITIGLVALFLLAGCATPLTPRESGTLTGAGIGAATGAVLGGIAGSAGKGAAIGAAVGAVTGLLAGNAIQNEQAAQAAGGYPPRYGYGSPPPPYPPPYPQQPPPPSPNASLQIEAIPADTEIIVDGRRIGLVQDFQGPVVVPVVAGQHVVQLSWRGFSITNHIVVSPQTTVIVRRDLARSAAAPPFPPPGANRQPPY